MSHSPPGTLAPVGLPRHPAGAAAAEPPKWTREAGRGSSMRWPSNEQGTVGAEHSPSADPPVCVQDLPAQSPPTTQVLKPSLGQGQTRAGAASVYHLPSLENRTPPPPHSRASSQSTQALATQKNIAEELSVEAGYTGLRTFTALRIREWPELVGTTGWETQN